RSNVRPSGREFVDADGGVVDLVLVTRGRIAWIGRRFRGNVLARLGTDEGRDDVVRVEWSAGLGVDRQRRGPLHVHLAPAEQPGAGRPRERVDVSDVEDTVGARPAILLNVMGRAQGL